MSRSWPHACSALCLLAALAFFRSATVMASVPAFAPMPSEVSSTHFTVTVNGSSSPVLHAVGGYYLLNFALEAAAEITVTSDDPHYWDAGVEVQPMRLGIRPHRDGATIRFWLQGPQKISITRPGDFSSGSEMLFLFANQPDRSGITAATPGTRFYAPGVYHENIDARSGDRIYLAAGAVVFGSLNLWQVQDVSVSGQGTLIYDGPQDPDHDEGWMHKPNWHVIVMDNARDVHIEGITGIVRSRTWMVQMRDSRDITFRNVKVIGGSKNNANQDGMDWLGGGDTLVDDSFFRAADDVFSMEGNWDGYSDEAMLTPGHLVSNITIQNSVLSTSISNVVRLGWPKKIFDSDHFTLRNSDVIHMGVGSCGIPFAFFEIWADPAGKGRHSSIHLEDIRLDEWYSLLQLRQPDPAIADVTLKDIWAMDAPGKVSSELKGSVQSVSFQGVNLNGSRVIQDDDVPLQVVDGAQEPQYKAADLTASFTYSDKPIKPGRKVTFRAQKQPGSHYQWLFGDGIAAEGAVVKHVFPDTNGTLLDGTGRFRVLLHVQDSSAHQAWASQSVVVAHAPEIAVKQSNLLPGLTMDRPEAAGSASGYLNIPRAGGYTVTLLTSTAATLSIDGHSVQSRKPAPQVCGSQGNAVQALRLSLVLAAGEHVFAVDRGPELENAEAFPGRTGAPVLLWEGPGLNRQPIPMDRFAHVERVH